MYSSKSDHNRSRWENKGNWSRPKRVVIADQDWMEDQRLVADLAHPMPAKPIDRLRPEPLEEEPLAEWEIDLLHDEALAWSSSEHEVDGAHSRDWDEDEEGVVTYYGDPALYDDQVEESLDDVPDDHWIPVVTYGQALDEMGAFIITGSPTVPLPPKRDYYMRVYELARELGVNSKPLIAHLRLRGEYVTTHQSWVALPVAKALLEEDEEALVAALGERTTKETPAQRWHAALLQERVRLMQRSSR